MVIQRCVRCKKRSGEYELLSGDYVCALCTLGSSYALDTLAHFSDKEFPFELDGAMDMRLLVLLDVARELVGFPFIIHSSYSLKGHSRTGYHPKGQAVDGHFRDISPVAAYGLLDSWWPGGLGAYPYWNSPGFHLDVGPRRRWWKDGKTLIQGAPAIL